jgi:hypothetical protein
MSAFGKSRYLVDSPNAVRTIGLLQTEVGLKTRFGDPAKFGEDTGLRLQSLHNTVRDATARVVALADDRTRTEVAKHHAAKLLAEKATKAIGETVKDFSVRSKLLQRGGAQRAERAFAPREGYAHIESEVRQWVREQMKTPDGIGAVSGMMKEDAAFAAIVCHSPHYLVGVAKEVHSKWYMDAVERYVPDAYAMLEESNELSEVVSRAEDSIREINTAFFNAELAKQAETRVEID